MNQIIIDEKSYLSDLIEYILEKIFNNWDDMKFNLLLLAISFYIGVLLGTFFYRYGSWLHSHIIWIP